MISKMTPKISGNDLIPDLSSALNDRGFVRISSGQTGALLANVASEHWMSFRRSWDRLDPDRFMADGGDYRRRSFSIFCADSRGIERKPHQPHYQERIHNNLNGGIARWFMPMSPSTSGNPVFNAILRLCHVIFRDAGSDVDRKWRVEVHQIRIECASEVEAFPTPEGLHRDGVDWVFVMLVNRHNILGGITGVYDSNIRLLENFTLEEPGEAVLINDREILHDVSSIFKRDGDEIAYRDVLIVTFRQE